MKNKIIEIAKSIDFDLIGFSECREVDEEFKEFYMTYIKKNYHGQMVYLEKNIDKRFDPRKIFPEARTIISLGVSYYSEISEKSLFPRYLTKVDYHKVLKKMMKKLVEELKRYFSDIECKIFVDTGPILEKYWAKKSGIGFIGKNSLIINPIYGSFIFLCEILINKEIEPDKEIENRCGNCKKCIDSCPTGAIISDGIVDAKKCISYLTIEKKELSLEEKDLIKRGNKIFGCEICQEVCPFNKYLKESNKEELKIPESLKNIGKEDILKIDLSLFKSTVIRNKFRDLTNLF